jgi:hypothetical protein
LAYYIIEGFKTTLETLVTRFALFGLHGVFKSTENFHNTEFLLFLKCQETWQLQAIFPQSAGAGYILPSLGGAHGSPVGCSIAMP